MSSTADCSRGGQGRSRPLDVLFHSNRGSNQSPLLLPCLYHPASPHSAECLRVSVAINADNSGTAAPISRRACGDPKMSSMPYGINERSQDRGRNDKNVRVMGFVESGRYSIAVGAGDSVGVSVVINTGVS